jgi:cardiolipin synthase A/B
MNMLLSGSRFGIAVAFVVVLAIGCTSSNNQGQGDATLGDRGSQPAVDQPTAPTDFRPATTQVSIIVEPTDNAAALISAIRGAKTSVHMTMYLMTSDSIVNALVAAKNAGREVKVILNKTFPSGTSTDNQSSFSDLQTAGVDVHWSWSEYTLTHQKTVIIDSQTAWIMTMNATVSAPKENREYLAVDSDPDDVAEAEAIFQADFNSTRIMPSGKLLVSPINAVDGLLSMIRGARTSIDIEAETLSDTAITDALVESKGRGVTVQIVLADDPPSSAQTTAVSKLKAGGAKLVSVSTPYIHAKSMVIDGTRAYVGSENYTTSSLKYNRELGVVFTTPSEVAKVLSTTRSDFAKGTAL